LQRKESSGRTSPSIVLFGEVILVWGQNEKKKGSLPEETSEGGQTQRKSGEGGTHCCEQTRGGNTDEKIDPTIGRRLHWEATREKKKKKTGRRAGKTKESPSHARGGGGGGSPHPPKMKAEKVSGKNVGKLMLTKKKSTDYTS